MKSEEIYQKLQFDRPISLLPRPLVRGIVTAIVFTLIWHVVPMTTLYWLMLPTVSFLVWMAGFGKQESLTRMIAILRKLEGG